MNPQIASAPVKVRPVCDADAESLAQLSAQLGYPSDAALMRRRLALIAAREDHAVFVMERAEAAPADGSCRLMLGWIHVARGLWLESGERAEILGLVVAAEARRAGVGRRLVAAAEQWSRAAGLAHVVVRSNALRTEAHAFYPALDYRLVKTQRVYVKTLAG